MPMIEEDFVRDCWYVVGWSSDFSEGVIESRRIIDEPVVFYRKQDGRLAAFADRCIHRHAPLSLGRLEGDDIRCMYHGLRFDSDGLCVEIPGQASIPKGACLRTYPVAEKGSWVWVWMGDPAAADVALIPPVRGFDDPEWALRSGMLDYDAPYELINDNLLDLSHLAFVHAQSFGATKGWSDRQPVTITMERGIRVERWIEGAPPIPPLPSLSMHKSVDVRSYYEFHVPGIFIMRTSFHPTGTAQASDYGEPVKEELFSHYSCQTITPMTRNTSRTMFTWGPGKKFGDENIAQQMIDMAHIGFREDKVIIEAQYSNIAKGEVGPIIATESDKALTIFRRIMKRLRTASVPSHEKVLESAL